MPKQKNIHVGAWWAGKYQLFNSPPTYKTSTIEFPGNTVVLWNKFFSELVLFLASFTIKLFLFREC
jgi:hypothetical protein